MVKVETIEPSPKGATIVFSDGSQDEVADIVAGFFAEFGGLKFEGGDKLRGTYGSGSAGARALAGGLVKRRKFDFSVNPPLEDRVHVVIESAMSGWSGSALGVMRERKNRKEFTAALQQYFSRLR